MQQRRHTRNIFALSVALTFLTMLLLLSAAGWFTADNSTEPSDFPLANEAGDPLWRSFRAHQSLATKWSRVRAWRSIRRAALPDFTLLSQEEQQVSLSDFRGKHVLLFFGYTNCPDVCPLTLDGFRRIHSDLEPEQQEQLAFVFISVDGARDTPQRLREYLAAFDVPVTALWGDDEENRQRRRTLWPDLANRRA